MLGWRRQSRYPLDLSELAAGHWLLEAGAGELVATIADRMGADLDHGRQRAIASRTGT